MITFDPSGQVAVVALDLIEHVNAKFPDLAAETVSLAGLMFTIEKAILAKTDPMDFVMVVTIAWAFISGMQKLVELADTLKVPEEPPAPESPKDDAPKVVTKTAKGVH